MLCFILGRVKRVQPEIEEVIVQEDQSGSGRAGTPDRLQAGRQVLAAFQEESLRLAGERVQLLGEICVAREALRQEDALHQALTSQLDHAGDLETVSSQNRDLLIGLLNERAELVSENVQLNREEHEVRQMLQFAEGFLQEGCDDSDTGDTVVVRGDGDVSPLWFMEEGSTPVSEDVESETARSSRTAVPEDDAPVHHAGGHVLKPLDDS